MKAQGLADRREQGVFHRAIAHCIATAGNGLQVFLQAQAGLLNEALAGLEGDEGADILDRDRITLGLIALAGHERDTILARMRERTISARMAEQVLSHADRLIEGARTGGRTGYQRAARQSVDYGRAFRTVVLIHGRLGLSGPLARMTADRFELLLSQRLILRDLDAFIGGRIRRIHGRRVSDLLQQPAHL